MHSSTTASFAGRLQNLARYLFRPTIGRPSHATLLVRLAVGGVFVSSGLVKFLFDNQGPGRFAKLGFPAARELAYFVGGPFFDELTHEQIAAVLQTPVGTTKTRIRLALKRLAPLLVIAVAGAFVAVVLRRQDDRAARTEDALRMVTASDVLPLRLSPAPGAPADAHGSYRARRGASVAVLTTSHLAPLTGSETYAAYARHGDAWERLGQVVVEADGRSVLVCASDPNAPTPDAIRVTKEGGASGARGPEGPLVLEWSGAALLPR